MNQDTIDVSELLAQGWVERDTGWVAMGTLAYFIHDVVGAENYKAISYNVDLGAEPPIVRMWILISPEGMELTQKFYDSLEDTDDPYQGAV